MLDSIPKVPPTSSSTTAEIMHGSQQKCLHCTWTEALHCPKTHVRAALLAARCLQGAANAHAHQQEENVILAMFSSPSETILNSTL